MRAFNERTWNQVRETLINNLKSDINSLSKKKILSIDREEYLSEINDKFKLEPLTIDFDSEDYTKPRIGRHHKTHNGITTRQKDEYKFVISYNFTGSPVIFEIDPPNKTVITENINVDPHTSKVSFKFIMNKKDSKEFFDIKDQMKYAAFKNLENANSVVTKWNSHVGSISAKVFDNRRKYFEDEEDFFKAIKIKPNPKTQKVFNHSVIKKKKIPQPKRNKEKKVEIEPALQMSIYNDVIDVLYHVGKNMEKKKSLYEGKNEEALRDIFVLMLETRYISTTASGETFNKGGKTDIILKYEDGSSLFVAECKNWSGISDFLKAINQLFDRYLTWRDSKVAIMLFIKNKSLQKVNDEIMNKITKHEYYIRSNGQKGETSFSYIFRLPKDGEKLVYLEVMTFHYHE